MDGITFINFWRLPPFSILELIALLCYNRLVKLIAQVKLLPDQRQTDALRRTLVQANKACQYVGDRAWETKTFRQYNLHHLCYQTVRKQFDLSAQVTVRVIAKVADTYKVDKAVRHVFKLTGSISYDDRILSWQIDKSTVSIWSVAGRLRVPFACGQRQRALLRTRHGEADLVLRGATFYLFATCEVEEPDPAAFEDALGVDLGIVNIAMDSDGQTHTGATVEQARCRYAHRRHNLQRKGTHAARRKLARLKGKQRRYQTDINHQISKRLVQSAQDTGRAIALEDLSGIRSRTTVRRRQRARFANWSFFQLRGFIQYKAKRAGILVLLVDPRNTSRTCPMCGYIDKANRPSQSQFSCVRCGFADLADHAAALNIRARAVVNLPMVPARLPASAGASHPLKRVVVDQKVLGSYVFLLGGRLRFATSGVFCVKRKLTR
jgi:putative transposase